MRILALGRGDPPQTPPSGGAPEPSPRTPPHPCAIEILCLLQVSSDTPSAAPAGALDGADGQLQLEDFSGQPDKCAYAAPGIHSMIETVMYELAISWRTLQLYQACVYVACA